MKAIVRFNFLIVGMALIVGASLPDGLFQLATGEASRPLAGLTPTASPWFSIYLDNPRLLEMIVNDARYTAEAAEAAYSTDPARQSIFLTQANGTLQAGATIQAYVTLQAQAATLTPTPTPTPDLTQLTSPSPDPLQQAIQTHEAALTLYPTDPVNSSFALTESFATIYPVVYAGTPTPLPPPPYVGPYVQPYLTPPPAPSTAVEAVGMVGLGVVIGLIFGGPLGIVIGLILGRRRG